MSTREKHDFLYIHPIFHQLPGCIPMGVVGLVNSVDASKVGLFSHEVTVDHIRAARVIAMDVHWYFSLTPALALVDIYKKVNPEVKIILGGYTAAIYASKIAACSSVDYIMRGDTELPFKLLVQALLDGGEISGIPNIVSREFTTDMSYRLDSEYFSQLDYSNYDWFPSKLEQIQEPVDVGLLFGGVYNFPFIPVFRGCPYPCEFCYGGQKNSKTLFGRHHVARSAESVMRDLIRCSDDPRIPGVGFGQDFADFLPREYVELILSRHYDLKLYYEFYNLPSVETVQRFCECFAECSLNIPLYKEHGESPDMVNVTHLEEIALLIERNPHASLNIFNPRFDYRTPATFAWNRFLGTVASNEIWHIRVPDVWSEGGASDEDFNHFLKSTSGDGDGPVYTARAISGLLGPGQGSIPDRRSGHGLASHRMKAVEGERRPLRGCFPRYLWEERWTSGLDEGDETVYEQWVRRFVAGMSLILSAQTSPLSKRMATHSPLLHAENSGSVLLLNRARGSLDYMSRSPLHLGSMAAVRVAEEVHEILGLGTAEHADEPVRRPITAVVMDARFSELRDGFVLELEQAQESGIFQGILDTHGCLVDACRWASTPCPASRLERAMVDVEGGIRTCPAGRCVGTVGDENQGVLKEVLADQEAMSAERGCSQCPAESYCPRCIYLGGIQSEEYCSIIRKYRSVADLITVPHILREQVWRGTVEPGPKRFLRFEVTDEHRLLDQVSGSSAGVSENTADRQRILGRSVRFCAFDDTYYLCDCAKLALIEIAGDIVEALVAARNGEFQSFAALFFEQGSFHRYLPFLDLPTVPAAPGSGAMRPPGP
jgi:hypothetical protein